MSTQTKTRPDPVGMPDQLIDVRPSPQPQPTRPRRFRVTSTGAYFLALFVFVAAVVAWAMTSDVEQSQPATSDSLLHQSVRAREHAEEQSQTGQTQRQGQTVRAIEQAESQAQPANPGLSIRAIEQAESQAQTELANPGLSVRAIEQAELLASQQADGGSFSDKKAQTQSQGGDGPRPGQNIRELEHSAGQSGTPLDQLGSCAPVSGEVTPC